MTNSWGHDQLQGHAGYFNSAVILFSVYPKLCCSCQSKIKATSLVRGISEFHAGCTKEVDAWTFTPTSSRAVSGELNCWALLLDSCGSDSGAYTLTGKWVWVRVFFCSFVSWYRVHGAGFLALWHCSQKGAIGLWMPILPKGHCSVHSCPSSPTALPNPEVLLLPSHSTTRNYWVCSQVSLNTWLLSGNACPAVSLMQSITTPVWLRFDFHPYNFVGSRVAKWHWAEKSVKWNVFVIHLVEVLMSSLALIRAN